MGSMSIVHWLIVLAPVALIGLPVVKILKRMGFSGWWGLLALAPLANLIGLWVLASIEWPSQRKE
ncbi:hypothetical protein ASD47_04925 [Caulobacter sp. Root1472]|jgi:hypothetical protein|nr:hypothetical protein ASD47_04925 [Caulobacter sp. Root1472]